MNPIVIYYSYRNNTRKLANYIKDSLNCEVVELLPTVPYSTNYDEVVALGESEDTKNACPELQNNIPDLSQFNPVIICTPSWWDNLSPVMISFLKQYPLIDKRVYALATNGGFGIGKGKDCLEELCAGASLQSILEVPFDEDEMEISMKDVDEWIATIK